MTDACVHCGESTAFGSGKFVNRVSTDNGWSCSECLCFDCDRCRQLIAFNEDISPYDCGVDVFHDQAERVCYECLTLNEIKQLEEEVSDE